MCRPVIIYCFSNGGTYAYEEMYKLFRDLGCASLSLSSPVFSQLPPPRLPCNQSSNFGLLMLRHVTMITARRCQSPNRPVSR